VEISYKGRVRRKKTPTEWEKKDQYDEIGCYHWIE
jgi:hypothetical protein